MRPYSRSRRPIVRPRNPLYKEMAARTLQRVSRGFLARRRVARRRALSGSILRRLSLTRARPVFRRTSTTRRRF